MLPYPCHGAGKLWLMNWMWSTNLFQSEPWCNFKIYIRKRTRHLMAKRDRKRWRRYKKRDRRIFLFCPSYYLHFHLTISSLINSTFNFIKTYLQQMKFVTIIPLSSKHKWSPTSEALIKYQCDPHKVKSLPTPNLIN